MRIGSNTKMFTAVIVLQLVSEGKIGLDAPVETYLPGLARGEGIDGRHITVRQLLQHISGLPNYVPYLGDDVRYYKPLDLLDIALQHKADFVPGTKWKCSNTNYVLAGLITQGLLRGFRRSSAARRHGMGPFLGLGGGGSGGSRAVVAASGEPSPAPASFPCSRPC